MTMANPAPTSRLSKGPTQRPSRRPSATELALVVAILSLVVAFLNWLHPYQPVGPSPFAPEATFAVTDLGRQRLPTSTVFFVRFTATPVPPTPTPVQPTATQVQRLPTATVFTVRLTATLSAAVGKIVFDSPVDGKWQVFAINPDGTGLAQLTWIPAGIGDPAISPDGKMIVCPSQVNKLLLMNADGTGIRTIYEGKGETGWPSWSPASSVIVFASKTQNYEHLFVMNADGTDVKQLTSGTAEDVGPAYSPDGVEIAFSSNRSGTWEIHALAPATGEIVKLTALGDPHGQGWPTWSPDGALIAFESIGVEGSRDIYVANSDGTGVRNITNSPKYEGAPAWSPDGERIAFASDRDGSLDIYVMKSDGTDVRRLTRMWAWGPSWSSR